MTRNIDDLNESELFKKMATVSAALHLSLFIIFALKSFFLPSKIINLDSAVRVDLVGLPDKISALPPKIEAPPSPKPEEKMPAPERISKTQKNLKEDAVSLKKKAAMDKIKEFEKEERRRKSIENIENEVQKEEANARAEKVKKLLVKGNMVNPGTALHGVTKAEFNEYVAALHGQIQDHWNLPEWLTDAKLKATVIAFIDAQGKLVNRRLEKSSGDDRFDEMALKAVDEASPYPKPPDKFVNLVSTDGIVFNFP